VLDDPASQSMTFAHPHIPACPLPEAIDRFYTTDVFMHTWDLARATGQDDHLDPTEAAFHLAGLHRRLHALPARLSQDADVRILHMDLHPGNVMLTAHGPVVIDWRNATEGPADLDVALTAVILAQVAVDETHPLAASAGRLLSAFLDRVGGNPLSALDKAVAMRRADPNLTRDEVERLDAAAAAIGAGEPSQQRARRDRARRPR